MPRRLLVTAGVVLFRERHLDGHGMQPHGRDHVRRLGGSGLLQRFLDHLQAAIALLPEPEVIGVAQVDLQVRFLVGAESLFEDPLELDFDSVGQPKDGAVAAACRLGLALHQAAGLAPESG